jgi:hypothetical protein
MSGAHPSAMKMRVASADGSHHRQIGDHEWSLSRLGVTTPSSVLTPHTQVSIGTEDVG